MGDLLDELAQENRARREEDAQAAAEARDIAEKIADPDRAKAQEAKDKADIERFEKLGFKRDE